MNWSQAVAGLHDRVIEAFAEPVTLADGRTLKAVVDLTGLIPELRERGKTTGARLPVDRQVKPVARLHERDAAQLVEGDLLTVRGRLYRVVTLTPDGRGLTDLELMLSDAEAEAETRPWR